MGDAAGNRRDVRTNGYIALPEKLKRQTILALTEMGQVVTSSLELDDVLQRVLVEVSALIESDGVAILLPDGEELVFVAVDGEGAARLKGFRMPSAEGVVGYVMQTGRPVWLNRFEGSVPGLQIYRNAEAVSAFHTESLLAVPLLVDGRPIGVLEAVHGDAEGLHREDLEVLSAAATWAAIAISNAQLHQDMRSAAERQAALEERARLARDLHDAVTQSLYSMVVLAEAWRRQIDSGKLTPAREHIVELGELGQRALREARLLIYELQPQAVEEEGLLGALFQRLESVEHRAGIRTLLKMTDERGKAFHLPEPDDLQTVSNMFRLTPEMEAQLYRIAQEALNNSLKHAAATEVEVCLMIGAETIGLEVKDNGHGFDINDRMIAHSGFGLRNMKQRAERLGGRLSIESSISGGTTIRAEAIPYHPASAPDRDPDYRGSIDGRTD